MSQLRKNRNQGLDLLRIICMLMVICLHFFGHGGVVEGALQLWTPNWYIVQLIVGFCYVCVNCFVLISGYFLCTSSFRLTKWVSIWVEALFYSVIIYLLLVILGLVPLSVSGLVKSLLVFTMRRYWFVTAYLLLLIVSPLLNHAIASMNRRSHAACCAVMFLVFSVLHNIVYICDFALMNNGSGLIGFCMMYLFAAYIRKYVSAESISAGRAAIVYTICICVMVGERILAYWLTPAIFGVPQLTSLFYPNNSITNVIGSIAFFLVFLKISSVKTVISKIISFAAPVSFAAYLIHEHPMLRPVLWGWLKPYAYEQSVWLLPYMVVCVMGIFLVGCLVEHLRLWLFRVVRLDALLRWGCSGLTNGFNKLLDRFVPHVIEK